jgi:uncharacterized protein
MRTLPPPPKTVIPLPELHDLHDPIVRDLAWVITSPILLDASHADYRGQVASDAWCAARGRLDAPRIAALDKAPQPLHDYIAARPTRRLGHYFESLIAYWLTYIAPLDIVARNLQVRDAQRTVGEFDFILRDQAGQICHWEAAVKFYLQSEKQPETRVFLGPAGRDRLDLKIDKVFGQQLCLSQTEEGRAALLNAVGAGHAREQTAIAGMARSYRLEDTQTDMLDYAQAYIKGYLFYPPNTPQANIHGLSSQHLRGWWIRHGQALPQSHPDTRWVILSRLRWLSPAHLAANAAVMRYTEMNTTLAAHFAQNDEPLLLAELQADGAGRWDEVRRGFVVRAGWPVDSDGLQAL